MAETVEGRFPFESSGAKKRDYWFTVLLTDPVALPLTRLLAHRRVLTPDGVTAMALVLGLAVGVAFATATRAGLIVGAVLFYLAFVFDCVDGKLARFLGTTSPRGEALDKLADGGRRASGSLGIAAYLFQEQREDVLWAVIYVALAYFFLEISGVPKGEVTGGMGGRIAHALARHRLLPNPGMPDVQAIVFVFGPLSGLVVSALYAGIALVCVAILLTVYRRMKVT